MSCLTQLNFDSTNVFISVGTSLGQLSPEPSLRPLHKQWIPAEERPSLLRLMRVKYSC